MLALIIINVIIWTLTCVHNRDSDSKHHTITVVSSWGHSEAWPTVTDEGALSVLAVASGADLLILALIYI